MGLFGQKKTSAELLSEGKELFDSGEYMRAFLSFSKVKAGEKGDINYWIGRCFLAYYGEKHKDQDLAKAKRFLTWAAEEGNADAARFLRKISGDAGIPTGKDSVKAAEGEGPVSSVGDNGTNSGTVAEEAVCVPKTEESDAKLMPASAQQPAATQEMTQEELYTRGMELYRAGKYEEAVPFLEKVSSASKIGEFPDAKVGLGWIYENVMFKINLALGKYSLVGKAGYIPGQEAFIRLVSSREEQGTLWSRRYQTALKWSRELAASGNQKMAEYVSVLEGLYEQNLKMTEQNQRQKAACDAGEKAFREKKYDEALRQYKMGAALGSPVAIYNCGVMYYYGMGTETDRKEALIYYEKAAEQGHVNAQMRCGMMYDNGRGTDFDKKKALQWYLKAAKQGDLNAQIHCSSMYTWGDGADPDKTMAAYWLRKAMEQNETEIPDILLKKYDEDKEAEKDSEEAIRWCRKIAHDAYEKKDSAEELRQYKHAAIWGDAAAMRFVGDMYREGKGTPVDEKEALRWYLKAAEQGDIYSMTMCGIMYDYGGSEDAANALYWYEKAAEQGEAFAQMQCSFIYFLGIDTEGTKVADKAKALYWCKKAAEQGEKDAQYQYAKWCFFGEGMPADQAEALYWYEKAAEQGDIASQRNCGIMYFEGYGTAVDKARALYWYEKAAEQGNADSQDKCGYIYYYGEGAAVDKAKALYWYEKAAEQGIITAQFQSGFLYATGGDTAANRAKARMWFERAANQSEDVNIQSSAQEILREYF